MGRKFWIAPTKPSTIVMAIAFHIHKLHDTSKRYICLFKETVGLKFEEVRDTSILTLGENIAAWPSRDYSRPHTSNTDKSSFR